jgi:hypothetical protein
VARIFTFPHNSLKSVDPATWQGLSENRDPRSRERWKQAANASELPLRSSLIVTILDSDRLKSLCFSGFVPLSFGQKKTALWSFRQILWEQTPEEVHKMPIAGSVPKLTILPVKFFKGFDKVSLIMHVTIDKEHQRRDKRFGWQAK